jgi:hypothetical protein
MAGRGGGNNNPRGDNQFRNPGGRTGDPPARLRGAAGAVQRMMAQRSAQRAGDDESNSTPRPVQPSARRAEVARVTTVASSTDTRRQARRRARTVRREDRSRQQDSRSSTSSGVGSKLKGALKAVHKHSMYSDKSLTGSKIRKGSATETLRRLARRIT